MARQIIVTDIVLSADNSFTVFAVGWVAAPANRIIPIPNFVSRIPLASAVPSWGISAAEIAALQSGSVVEVQFDTGQLQAGSTPPQVQAALQAKYTAAQATISAKAAGTKFIGASFDGTNWSAAP